MIYIWSTNPKNLGSKLIQFGGKDRCSHFAMMFPEHGTVIESRVQTGVREVPISTWFNEGNRIVYQMDMTVLGEDSYLYAAAQALVGKRYDRLGVLFIALRTLFQFRLNRNPWGSREDYFCTEILSAHNKYLQQTGLVLPKEWEIMYPEDAYEYLARHFNNP